MPIAWAHAYGSDPHRLPVPPPADSRAWDWFEALFRGKGRRYLLPDGTIWEYRGLDNPQAGKRSAPKGVYVGESCVETPAGWVAITADFPEPPQQLRQLRIPFRSPRPERYSREEKLRALLSIWPPDQQPELRKRVERALEVK